MKGELHPTKNRFFDADLHMDDSVQQIYLFSGAATSQPEEAYKSCGAGV